VNNYFNTFENITQSVEQLLKDEHNSLDIKQSAASLKNSVKPCIEELKKSATKLQELILVCSDDLYRAENIWQSKPMIASAAKLDIWEQLGEISGRSIKISQIGSQYLIMRCPKSLIRRSSARSLHSFSQMSIT
jgi:hypothetical protein